MSALTILAPGLLGPWPPADTEGLPAPHAPALRRMLARGDRLPGPSLPFEDALARPFGHEGADLPWGALGLWGETWQRPEGFVLRADPVHLKLGMTEAIVFGGPSLQLTLDEASVLARMLEDHFAERGWRMTVVAPDRWYLHVPESADLQTTPLARALGRDAGLFKPVGRDAARWLADLTEVQMLLHSHPVNQVREARGLPAINSLWFWGAGVVPDSIAPGRSWTGVYSNHPLVRGLALAASVPAHDLPETVDKLDLSTSGHVLVVLDDALQPWQDSDYEDWLATLEGLEARWFAPLWRTLSQGRVQEMVIDAMEVGTWQVRRAHRWRFWRGSPSMENLCVPIA